MPQNRKKSGALKLNVENEIFSLILKTITFNAYLGNNVLVLDNKTFYDVSKITIFQQKFTLAFYYT